MDISGDLAARHLDDPDRAARIESGATSMLVNSALMTDPPMPGTFVEGVTWQDLFEPDGSLPDIAFLGTTEADWDWLLDYVRSSDIGYRCAIDSEPAELPLSYQEVLEIKKTRHLFVQIDPERLQLNSLFWFNDSIDLDFDPRDFKTADEARGLLLYLVWLADTLNKPVTITNPGASAPVWWYRPSDHHQ